MGMAKFEAAIRATPDNDVVLIFYGDQVNNRLLFIIIRHIKFYSL